MTAPVVWEKLTGPLGTWESARAFGRVLLIRRDGQVWASATRSDGTRWASPKIANATEADIQGLTQQGLAVLGQCRRPPDKRRNR